MFFSITINQETTGLFKIYNFITIFVQLLGHKLVNLYTLHNKSTNKPHSSVSKVT